MKALVIGGTGHIGRFLVPELVGQGWEVSVVSRGRTPVPEANAWEGVSVIHADYRRKDDQFSSVISEADAELVIDILGSDVPSTYQAAKGRCRHFIACGSVWMYGLARIVPTPEETQGPCEFDWYAMRYDELQRTKAFAEDEGIAFTAIMPPNVCGPGKVPIDCRGGRDIDTHKCHMRGEPVILPEGCTTLIGPCDASDVAHGFTLSACNTDKASGRVFNVGSAYALTAPELVREYGRIHGVKIPVEYVSAGEFYGNVLPESGANFHFRSHMAPDISNISRMLGYRPRYTPEQSLARAVEWMRNQGLL